MRWERLFAELEGHAEHAHREERDALVAELREGAWAERSWLDGLAVDGEAEIGIREIGPVTGRVLLANEQVVHVETRSAVHVVAASAVQWVRGSDRSVGLQADSVAARLGWGAVFREAKDDGDIIRLTLSGGTLDGTVVVVGKDFVRLAPGSGLPRDVPTAAILMATFPR